MDEPPAILDRPLADRHRLPTRIWHWVNALTVFILLMSGLMIFNAHPRLYWGEYGANQDKPWLQIGATTQDRGVLFLGDARFDTTGVLGVWTDRYGETRRTAFPGWVTIPSTYSLSAGRRWHLAFAWVLVIGGLLYSAISLINRHIQRDLLPRRRELAPRHVWREVKDHARLRFPRGEAALRYNALQKLAYVGVIFGLLPLLVLTGLTMSPMMNAAWPWLLDLFGGRQSARSIHFIAAMLMVLFIVVHLLMVLLSGPFNGIRAMITGRFRIPKERDA